MAPLSTVASRSRRANASGLSPGSMHDLVDPGPLHQRQEPEVLLDGGLRDGEERPAPEDVLRRHHAIRISR